MVVSCLVGIRSSLPGRHTPYFRTWSDQPLFPGERAGTTYEAPLRSLRRREPREFPTLRVGNLANSYSRLPYGYTDRRMSVRRVDVDLEADVGRVRRGRPARREGRRHGRRPLPGELPSIGKGGQGHGTESTRGRGVRHDPVRTLDGPKNDRRADGDDQKTDPVQARVHDRLERPVAGRGREHGPGRRAGGQRS